MFIFFTFAFLGFMIWSTEHTFCFRYTRQRFQWKVKSLWCSCRLSQLVFLHGKAFWGSRWVSEVLSLTGADVRRPWRASDPQKTEQSCVVLQGEANFCFLKSTSTLFVSCWHWQRDCYPWRGSWVDSPPQSVVSQSGDVSGRGVAITGQRSLLPTVRGLLISKSRSHIHSEDGARSTLI